MSGPWDKLTQKIVDTHCHVHHYENPLDLAQNIQNAGIQVHCVTVRPKEFSECQNLFKDFKNIIPCLGLFPLLVNEESQNLDLFMELMKQTRFIGEIGLDYSVTDTVELNLQREVFNSIITECSKLGDKILSVHSRRSADDVLKFIGSDFNGSAIMHWFSGHEDLVKKSPENIYYSVNTAMIKSRQGKKVLRALRPEQVLTETDGPYVKINEKPVEPIDIRNVVNALSQLWNKSLGDTIEILSQNYLRAIARS